MGKALHNIPIHLSFWVPKIATTMLMATLCGAAGAGIGALGYYATEMLVDSTALGVDNTVAIAVGVGCIVGLIISMPIFITVMMPYYERIFEKHVVSKSELVLDTPDELYARFAYRVDTVHPHYNQPENHVAREQFIDEQVQSALKEQKGLGPYRVDHSQVNPDAVPSEKEVARRVVNSVNWKHRVEVHHTQTPYELHREGLL